MSLLLMFTGGLSIAIKPPVLMKIKFVGYMNRVQAVGTLKL